MILSRREVMQLALLTLIVSSVPTNKTQIKLQLPDQIKVEGDWFFNEKILKRK